MGISGYALQQMDELVQRAQQAGKLFSAEDMERFLCWEFPDKLIQIPVYSKIVRDAVTSLTDTQLGLLAKARPSPPCHIVE